MWGSVLGGLIGAVVGAIAGGAVTYYRERRLEARREHEEALKELVPKLTDLTKQVMMLRLEISRTDKELNEERPARFPKEVYNLAREIELLASKLDSSELADDILRALNQEYNSLYGVFASVSNLSSRAERTVYPDVRSVKDEYGTPVEKLPKADERENWAGPANPRFVGMLYKEGFPPKEQWESED